MWTIFLPEELTVKLTPVDSASGITFDYTIEGMNSIGKLMVKLLGGVETKNVRITPERIELKLPENMPYRIGGLKGDNIRLLIKKRR